MNILFISYWSINEGLTHSTVIPHIKILSQYDIIKKIILITLENSPIPQLKDISKKTYHIPVSTSSHKWPIVQKFLDFITIPKIIKQHCIDFRIDKIIARGAMAGALAYLSSRNTQIPYYVESFEPHADYMQETEVWHKWGLKYISQKIWEKKQIQTAAGIMTVTEGYTNYLINQYFKNLNVITVPCAVDSTFFKYNPHDRLKIRKELGFDENQIIGIYTGKFGGLYIDIKDLKILSTVFDYFSNSGLIFLSPIPEIDLRNALKPLYYPGNKIIVKTVSHVDVPPYLSAADFALSLNKSFNSGKYLSPVKIGEYWANGLPVMMTEGIGDEDDFLEKEKGGVLFNLKKTEIALRKLKDLISDPNHRTRIPELARKYRSFDKVKTGYEKLILPKLIDEC
jgi:glycosyltransferase involved in cell wall biosynthesis